MSRWFNVFRIRADRWALETQIAQAGCALACRYSGSDEYEAAAVAVWRAARTRQTRRRAWLAGLAAAALFCVVIAI